MENYLTTTFITRPENDGTPITLTIPRLEYRDWIKDQEAIYNCRFYNKTKSDGGRRLKNNEYLEHGYIHPPPGQKRGRGNESFIFNEAGFTAFVNNDSVDKNMIMVQYRRKHTGHEPGSNIDTTSGALPRFVMEFIQAQVEKSLTWRNIKHMLRLDKDVLENILDSEDYDQLPQSVRIDYHHVYYVMKIHLRRQSQLHPSMANSLMKWGTKIQHKRGYFASKNLDRYEEGMFFFAFMSQWQLKLLKENGDLVSLDSTHKTCVDGTNHDCYLYTLVARCRITGKGKPLTWMITNSQAQYPILYWLQWLKDEHGYVPSRVMIDDSDTEIAAINKAYNTVNDDVSSGTYTDNVKILICHWHVLRAWKKNILTKLTAKPSTPSKTLKEKREMREVALSLMMNMMRAETPVDFDLEHEKFETWCIDVDEEWDGPELRALSIF
ncbi:hypothetical protein INT45_001375 [Circinella minor]|uniref:MULE transposase domain-containing protein n=1 Tax=Circinella minor TaxID=1195481 RepID=A0A8H7RV60_9FUNG|nr:hypothetical protein INT45_001375 [Circinella minor]